MTIEQVMKAGESVPGGFGDVSTWVWVVLAFSLFFIVMTFTSDEPFYMLPGMLLLIVGIIGGAVTVTHAESERFEKWEKEYVAPFIDELPLQKSEVVFIKIEADLELPENVYASNEDRLAVKKTPLTVSFKGNGVETYTDWVETHMELTDEEKPFIEYKRLEQDLGNGVDAGIYNKKIYLPESYTFTDIK